VREPIPDLKEPARDPANLEELWADFKAHVKRKSALLASKMDQGRCLGYDNGCLRIGLRKGSVFFEDLSEPAQRERLSELAGSFFTAAVTVEIEAVEAPAESGRSGGVSEAMARQSQLEEIRREALNHPLLQKVMNVFEGAEVREVKVRPPQKSSAKKDPEG